MFKVIWLFIAFLFILLCIVGVNHYVGTVYTRPMVGASVGFVLTVIAYLLHQLYLSLTGRRPFR